MEYNSPYYIVTMQISYKCWKSSNQFINNCYQKFDQIINNFKFAIGESFWAVTASIIPWKSPSHDTRSENCDCELTLYNISYSKIIIHSKYQMSPEKILSTIPSYISDQFHWSKLTVYALLINTVDDFENYKITLFNSNIQTPSVKSNW